MCICRWLITRFSTLAWARGTSLGKRHDLSIVSAHYAEDVQAFIDVRDLLNELISLINDLDLEWERKK
jgi:hypothetical protein